MTITKRLYLVIGLVALIALAFSAVTLTSSLTSADPTPTATCDQQNEADDAVEGTANDADTDSVEEQCGDQNEAEDASAETDTAVPCSDSAGADDDATEAHGGPDTDSIQEQCGDQNQAD